MVQFDRVPAAGIERRSAKVPATISPQIKSWIDNVIVPGLVEEFLQAQMPRKVVAGKSRSVVTSHANSMTTGEGIK